MKKKGLMWIRTPNSVTKVQDGTHRTNKTTLEEGDLLTRQDKATLVIVVPSIQKQKCNPSLSTVVNCAAPTGHMLFYLFIYIGKSYYLN